MPFKIIGYVGRSSGLEGKFFLSRPRLNAQALRSLKYIYVGNGAEPEDVHEILAVEERGTRLCVQLKAVTSREQADRLTHSALFVTGKQADRLPDFREDPSCVGFEVRQDGELLGTVKDVRVHPAQDMLIFTAADGSDVMVPFVDAFITSVDKKKRILHVRLLEGMMHED